MVDLNIRVIQLSDSDNSGSLVEAVATCIFIIFLIVVLCCFKEEDCRNRGQTARDRNNLISEQLDNNQAPFQQQLPLENERHHTITGQPIDNQGFELLPRSNPIGRETATNQEDIYRYASNQYQGYGAPVYYNFEPSGQQVVSQDKKESNVYHYQLAMPTNYLAPM